MNTLIINTTHYKIFLLILLGLLTAFGPFVTDMYLPALPSMANWFGTTTSLVQLSLTSCMIGLALGQLFLGPISDRYGRKQVLLWTLFLFIMATLLCLFSVNIQMFVSFRLLQGIGAAGSIVIARSISTDMFNGRELAKILAIVGSINGIAPVLAPVVGGTMVEFGGWGSIFVILLFIGILLLFASLYYKESLPLERRVQSSLSHILSYFAPLLKNRPYMGYMLQLGFAQAALFANIASAPFIMQQHYGFTPFLFSVCFGINALAVVISAALAAKFKEIKNGTLLGSVGLLIFSICEAIVLFNGYSFWAYEGFMISILFSLGLCFTSSTTLAMDKGRELSGSASALLGAVSFAFGGIVSSLVGIGNPLQATGIVFVVCAVCSFVCVYIVDGRFIRYKSMPFS
ncbi:MAG: bcr [Bacteroidetes bacterium]|jgi:MFS transporter, DHA1 family, multidrug resistance protein|nr:bcr [Bacteroidota bacterium]